MFFRKAKKGELIEIAELMTKSFSDYSCFKVYIKDRGARLRFLKSVFMMFAKACYKQQDILVGVQNEEIVAVAMLKAPDKPELSLWDFGLAGGINVLIAGGLKDTFEILSMSKELSSMCYKTYPHSWYLTWFAISDLCQGQGVGSSMLNDCVKPYIAEHGGGTFTLITNEERNRAFYVKNGFTEFHGTEIYRNNQSFGNWSYKTEIAPDRLI